MEDVLTYVVGATFGPAVGAFFFFRWRHARPGYKAIEGGVTFVLLLTALVGYVLLMLGGVAALKGEVHSDWVIFPGVAALFLGFFMLPALVGLLLGHIAAVVVRRVRPGTGR